MGERGFLSTIAGMLAHALCAQGAFDEAESFSLRSREYSAQDDLYSQMLWRTSLAKVRSERGEHDNAVALATEAIELAKEGELLSTTGDAWCDLAEVFDRAGRSEEARAAFLEAIWRYRDKQNLVSLARVEARLEEAVPEARQRFTPSDRCR